MIFNFIFQRLGSIKKFKIVNKAGSGSLAGMDQNGPNHDPGLLKSIVEREDSSNFIIFIKKYSAWHVHCIIHLQLIAN
jgi:hypothetical protein